MSQQPNPWGQPPQQQYPQQGYPQQGPPQNMEQSWQQAQQGPQQAAPTAPQTQNDSGGFFGGMGGGGEIIPSFKFEGTGSAVQGRVQSCEIVGVKDFTTQETIHDARTGEEAKQLKIVLQTDLRQWQNVSRIPAGDDGAPLPPGEDDGRRAVYTGGKSAKGQSWMSGAINDALVAAGRNPAQGIEIGAMLGVAVSEEVPSGKGNPYKKYVAKYASPSQGGFEGPPKTPQGPQEGGYSGHQQPQAAPQGQGYQQQPQQGGYAPPQGGDPHQGYQPPQQPAPQPQQPSQGNPWGGGPNYGEPPF